MAILNDYTDRIKTVAVGCIFHCPYCYARAKHGEEVFKKVTPRERDINSLRVARMSTPESILINHETDLGALSTELVNRILDVCAENPHDTFVGLSKAKESHLTRLWADAIWKRGLQDRFFIGIDITQKADKKKMDIPRKESIVRWINIEPMLTALSFKDRELEGIQTICIGAEVPAGFDLRLHPVKEKWVERVLRQADKFSIPIFMKPSMTAYVGKENFRQDAPIWGLRR